MSFDSFDGIFRAGFNLQNLGPKISYTEDAGSESFIPSNLRLGAGFDFILMNLIKFLFTVKQRNY